MGHNDHLHDDCVVLDYERRVHETEGAVLYSIDGDEVWIPKSCIEEESDETVVVKSWFAKKEGLA